MDRKKRLMNGSAKGITGTLPFADNGKMIKRAVYSFNKSLWDAHMAREKSRADQPAAMPESGGYRAMAIERMQFDSLISTLRRTQNRFENGPVCALCVHSSFTPSDLPSLIFQEKPDMQATMTRQWCPVRSMNIMADSGEGCASYQGRRS